MTAATLVLFAVFAAADDPVVLEFSSRNCPACRTAEPVVRQLAAEGFPIRQIDGDVQPQLVKQFQIKGYPTFILVAGGREAGRIEGAANRERLVQLLQQAAPLKSASRPTDIVRGQTPEPRPVAAASSQSPDQSALAATVRLKVDDAGGTGVGTGTIIDSHYNEEAKAPEALIVTCGHLFRESQGKGKITVELFSGGAARKVEGTLLDYNLERDIALVTCWPGTEVIAAQVAPKNFVSRPQDRVFSVGCDKGADPTVQATRINAVNRFQGKPNITAAGMPVDGRSGGGLFTAEGMLIGVCNAANPADNEGLYASLPTIQWQLDKFNLQEIYERAAVASTPAAVPAAAPVPTNELPGSVQPVSFAATQQQPVQVPELPAQMPRAAELSELTSTATDNDMEVVCIVRSKRRTENQSEIYVVDHVPQELLSRITTAARQSAQARVAGRSQVQLTDRTPRSEQPVVRGQLKQ